MIPFLQMTWAAELTLANNAFPLLGSSRLEKWEPDSVAAALIDCWFRLKGRSCSKLQLQTWIFPRSLFSKFARQYSSQTPIWEMWKDPTDNYVYKNHKNKKIPYLFIGPERPHLCIFVLCSLSYMYFTSCGLPRALSLSFGFLRWSSISLPRCKEKYWTAMCYLTSGVSLCRGRRESLLLVLASLVMVFVS